MPSGYAIAERNKYRRLFVVRSFPTIVLISAALVHQTSLLFALLAGSRYFRMSSSIHFRCSYVAFSRNLNVVWPDGDRRPTVWVIAFG